LKGNGVVNTVGLQVTITPLSQRKPITAPDSPICNSSPQGDSRLTMPVPMESHYMTY